MLSSKNIQGWISWGLAVFFLILQFNVQTAYAIINPEIQNSIGITLSEVALSATIYNVVYAVCQLFGGAFLDKFGSRYTLLPAVVLVSVGTYLYSVVGNVTELFFSQVIIAIGASVSFVGAGYVGGQWFGSDKFGLFFGYVQALTGVSAAFSQFLIKKVVFVFNWQHVLFCFSLLGFVLVGLFYFLFIEPRNNNVERGGKYVLHDLLSVFLSDKKIFLIGLWAGVAFGCQLALGVVWAPKILVIKGFDDAVSGYASMAIWLGLGAGALVWDRIGYHSNHKRLIVVICFVTMMFSLSCVLLLGGLSLSVNVFLMFLFGFGNGVHMLAFSCASDFIPTEKIGSASAVINTMFFIIAGVLTSIPNFIMHYFDELNSLLFLIVLLFFAMIVAVFSMKNSMVDNSKG